MQACRVGDVFIICVFLYPFTRNFDRKESADPRMACWMVPLPYTSKNLKQRGRTHGPVERLQPWACGWGAFWAPPAPPPSLAAPGRLFLLVLFHSMHQGKDCLVFQEVFSFMTAARWFWLDLGSDVDHGFVGSPHFKPGMPFVFGCFRLTSSLRGFAREHNIPHVSRLRRWNVTGIHASTGLHGISNNRNGWMFRSSVAEGPQFSCARTEVGTTQHFRLRGTPRRTLFKVLARKKLITRKLEEWRKMDAPLDNSFTPIRFMSSGHDAQNAFLAQVFQSTLPKLMTI